MLTWNKLMCEVEHIFPSIIPYFMHQFDPYTTKLHEPNWIFGQIEMKLYVDNIHVRNLK